MVLAQIIQSEGFDQEREVVVLGDMNDYDPSVVDAAQSVPTSRVLEILRNANASDSSRRLLNVGTLANVSYLSIYSAWWDQNNSCVNDGPQEDTLIDHILVSSGLVPYIYSVQYLVNLYPSQTVSCGGNYSDHWPILVEFRFPDSELPPDNAGWTPVGTFLVVILAVVLVLVVIAIVMSLRS
jgi:exonuclease III